MFSKTHSRVESVLISEAQQNGLGMDYLPFAEDRFLVPVAWSRVRGDSRFEFLIAELLDEIQDCRSLSAIKLVSIVPAVFRRCVPLTINHRPYISAV